VQLAAPATENCVAEQFAHTRLLEAVQSPPTTGAEPAAHEVLQLAQG